MLFLKKLGHSTSKHVGSTTISETLSKIVILYLPKGH